MVVGVGVGRGESEPGGGKNGRERGGEEEEPFSYTVAYFSSLAFSIRLLE